MAPQSVIDLQYRGRVAILTIENEQKLNALGKQEYYDLAQRMREVAARDEVVVTVLLARGRYFSAGADVSFIQNAPTGPEAHQHWLSTFVASNLNITHAFATHPKVIVVGLNGPVVGLTAALVAHADFIYCTPSTFLLTPFSSIGLVAEGGASRALAQRLGPARANEALLMSRPIDAAALERCGFVNDVFDEGDEFKFRARVLREVDERLGEHLQGSSLIGIKKLIRLPEMEIMHRQNVHEVFAGWERFMTGVPQEEFAKIASGAKRHKL